MGTWQLLTFRARGPARMAAMLVATIASGLTSSVSAQGEARGPRDPWTILPALSNACYYGDDYGDKVNEAIAAIDEERVRQEEVNRKIREPFAAMDMSVRMQRMQAFMMQNPQDAMKMLQGEQTAAAELAEVMAATGEVLAELEPELEKHVAAFQAAAETAVKPFKERQEQLINTKTESVGEIGAPRFRVLADEKQYLDLIDEENRAYEGVCAQYFGAEGALQEWLKRYRSEVIEKVADVGIRNAGAVTAQMKAMGVPSEGHYPTDMLSGAATYANRVIQVYNIRIHKAVSQVIPIK